MNQDEREVIDTNTKPTDRKKNRFEEIMIYGASEEIII